MDVSNSGHPRCGGEDPALHGRDEPRAFERDEKLIDAVVHNLTIIGEAANHVPSEITAKEAAIPWRQMIDLRNYSVHAYWNLRPAVIWDTIQNDLPPLVEPLRRLLSAAQ